MRLILRFVIPVALVISLVAYGVTPLVNTLILKWFARDLDIRTNLITNAMQDSLVNFSVTRSDTTISNLFERVIQDERLYALGFCDSNNRVFLKTLTFPAEIQCDSKLLKNSRKNKSIIQLRQGSMLVVIRPVIDAGRYLGNLVLIHDMSFIQKRISDIRKYIFIFFGALALIISLMTGLIAQLSLKGWISGLRAMLKREKLLRFSHRSTSSEFKPIVKDLRKLVQDLESDRRARDETQVSWSPLVLKEILHRELAGNEVLIASNRGPYMYVKKDEKIEVQVPASGLVTALEPIMRACSGTWIAHGKGSADREVVDERDHIQVPPEDPSYQIRCVWLTQEEEAGYYYGFANEGLWPLCHIAHTRPTFRTKDWKQYVGANKKFAKAVIEEAKTEDPVILVQDYHLALLPKMIKEKLPGATVITFWHIPWPNPESFAICPWREELVDGLLGSSILGFHTRFHCNNFLDTVDQSLESRIDRENSTVSYGNRLTAVNSYPISIEYPVRWLNNLKSVTDCRKYIRKINKLPEDRFIGIGVDRLDYTKGILERFLAVERLLESQPQWIGKFTFIQIASPTRSSIHQYRNFAAEVLGLADKINNRFSSEEYKPICLKVEHHEPHQVFEYFRGADLCFVSSLHDGMNLVAKEFIAARDDEQGVLILSQFTGASKELPESLIVNPYDVDQCAAALHAALAMPQEEQRKRIRSMRGLIQEFNVYRWAGKMLLDAERLRRRGRFMKGIPNLGWASPS